MSSLHRLENPSAEPALQHTLDSEQGSFVTWLDNIITHRRLTPWFQPIVDLADGKIIGYEALVRGPSNSPLHSPANLFNAAIHCDRLTELEMLCRDVNIEFFSRLKLPGKLFLNVSPKALLEPNFPHGFTRQTLAHYGMDPRNVVIELTENFPILDIETIRSALNHYRQEGFKVALDDLGSAYAGLRLWSELKPDLVKFDKYFIQSINRDKHKKQLIQSLQEIAKCVDCRTIAEGIETLEEYYVVQALGVTYGQGYYFSRPSPSPPQQLPSNIVLNHETNQQNHFKWRTESVSGLIKTVPTTCSSTTLNTVGDLFENMPELLALPVVDEGQPVGMLHRHEVMNILASRYGRDLRGNNSIREFMNISPLCIEKDVPIEKLSEIITKDDSKYQGNYFIITDNDSYLGVGMVTDLLKRITELQIRNARYANPLTLLPGNVPINEHLEHLLENYLPFTACYFDLDNFKPFNDLYGYSRGDMVIRLLGTILQSACNPQCDFIGHIGGDDFMIIFRSQDWKQRCKMILARFEEEVIELFDEEDRKQGGITSTDRTGQTTFYAITSVSIGATSFDGDTNHCCSQHEIALLASEAKKIAKKTAGNTLFINRRKCSCGS
ncbi:GGDEF domain-containing protein [Desulfuromonas acetoxidans]|uniref:Diguanylate cyclase/phosphodiesterase n=1 Tax=Desulfuromonas acetoxidans (strain DSM 684 / 11070) TaxID=281689 RepID=Q1JYN5_DESA6|nr:GGDEF domain-containing protein [Desulfuromonas acetoxidans]EAT15380.1 diguanylate cyclase/phosphodiesterase [Desulfuromonas acetoxidans DSM 684]MBF0646210.1 GGDEF domain-containing protein [Desulfuromonas acetoxidans]NVD24411.1 GGDEF domain-containing protein [Desulfuromonas acetoxidans]NVE16641.1 GGDEF domain-containing protein [Desulfuromonas acetoxidans]